MHPIAHPFFDAAMNTLPNRVQEPDGRTCAVIDGVPDFDHASGRTDPHPADVGVAFITARGLDLQ